jgi:regulatory protein
MDREEHGESSSSPNDKRRIDRISKRAAGGNCEILLSDGSSFFCGPDFLSAHALEEGSRVGEEGEELLAEETFRIAARGKALDYLARREHSRKELETKLLQKGYPRRVVEETADECEERGYLDDERFARLWTEARLKRKAEGPQKIAALLSKKGIAGELIEGLLREFFSEDRLSSLIEEAAAKGRKKYGDEREKLQLYLFRKGFTYSQISNYFH